MGFGYLFIGYLITFVLYLTVQALGLGGLALLLGTATMLLGLLELTRYQRAFAYAKWLCLPLMATAIYQALLNLFEQNLQSVPLFGATVSNIVTWVQFILIITFQLAMLYAIRAIATEVGLLHISTKALRNSLFVGLYAVLYLLTNLVFLHNGEIRQYFAFSLMVSQLATVLFNLLLLISCTKNICAEGQDDEEAQKSSSSGFWGRIKEIDDRTRQRSIDRAKEQGAAFAERRRRKKEERKNRK